MAAQESVTRNLGLYKEFLEDELLEFHDAFNMFAEKDDSGDEDIMYVTADNLKELLGEVGDRPTEAELQDMLNELEESEEPGRIKGRILFPQFIDLLKRHLRGPQTEEEMREAFRIFDKDGFGELSADEFKFIATSLGESYTDEEIADIIKEVDVDGNGKISFDDFFITLTTSTANR